MHIYSPLWHVSPLGRRRACPAHFKLRGAVVSQRRRLVRAAWLVNGSRSMTQTPPFGTPKPPHDATSKSPVDASKPQRTSLWRTTPWPWIGSGLAAVALAYGVGRLQGAQGLNDAEQRHAAAIESLRSNLETCGIDRTLLNARRSLALVALSLDRRNFGVAESHRREASQALEQPSLSGLPEVAAIATTISALDLSVDPDPGAKREQVIAASEALDGLLATRARTQVPAQSAAEVTP